MRPCDIDDGQEPRTQNLRAAAVADLRVARAAQLHFASVDNQAQFILARDALLADPGDANTDIQRLQLIAFPSNAYAVWRKPEACYL